MPPDQLTDVFEAAFNALWLRARTTLGDVTLNAIVLRVFYTTGEQYPFLATLKVGSNGLDCSDLRQRAHALDRDRLTEGLHFVLVELLTVIGALTADILSPALHQALRNVTIPEESQLPDGSLARKRNHDT